MSPAITRRAALRGSAAVALGLVGSACSPAKGHAAAVARDFPSTADVDLIDLANRLQALAARDDRANCRAADIQDAVTGAIGFPPHRPEISIDLQSKIEVIGDRVVSTLTRPVRLPEHDAILDAHEIAVAAYEKRRSDMERRLGRPEVDRRIARMGRRRDRWAADLAELRPATAAGLAAKAEAVAALAGRDGDALNFYSKLVMAVLDDVVRFGLGSAS